MAPIHIIADRRPSVPGTVVVWLRYFGPAGPCERTPGKGDDGTET